MISAESSNECSLSTSISMATALFLSLSKVLMFVMNVYFTITSNPDEVMQPFMVEGSLNVEFHFGSIGMISSKLLSKAPIDFIST